MLENPIETFSVKKQLMMFFFDPRRAKGSPDPLRWRLHSHQPEIRVLHA